MTTTKSKFATISIIIILTITCYFVYIATTTTNTIAKAPISSFLGKLNGYKVTQDIELDSKTVKMLDLDDYFFSDFMDKNGNSANLFVGFYYTVKKISAPHAPDICFPAQGWTISEPIVKKMTIKNYKINLTELTATKDGRKELVYYWFQAHHATTANSLINKFKAVYNNLFFKQQEHAFVRISIPYTNTNYEEATSSAINFTTVFYHQFIKYIDNTQNQHN